VVTLQSCAEVSTRALAGRNGLLAGLPPDELDQLRPYFETVRLKPEQFVLPAEAPLQHVYFPLGGLTSLMVSALQGGTVQVAAVGREGMLGVSVVLEASESPFEIVCQVAGEALRMPTADCTRFAQLLPTFRRRLARYALALLHEAARTAACNGLHSVEQRLARWLLLCCARVGASSFPVTHESLAQMLGVSRPFVTQTAGGLVDAGLIEHQRGVMRIIDRAGLAAIACEDYRAVEDAYTRLLA
jgi:CRP-like cAMP-binding protein